CPPRQDACVHDDVLAVQACACRGGQRLCDGWPSSGVTESPTMDTHAPAPDEEVGAERTTPGPGFAHSVWASVSTKIAAFAFAIVARCASANREPLAPSMFHVATRTRATSRPSVYAVTAPAALPSRYAVDDHPNRHLALTPGPKSWPRRRLSTGAREAR